MHAKQVFTTGTELRQANKALVMVHGRGGSAEDILSLANYLQVQDFALVAPQATQNTWYPQSFLAPPAHNEPWLSSALQVLEDVLTDIKRAGVTEDNIYLLGFSQGACLTLEFAARNATRYGGIVAFTGGLIGDRIYIENYKGDFSGTPIFIGTSNPDPHVPVNRVHDTTSLLREMNAQVTEKVYDNMGHTISQEEISQANSLVFNPEVKQS